MATWSFLRHGESRANAEGWFAGTFDTPLTEQGIAQAIDARESIAGLSIVRVFTSDLCRATHTAELALNRRAVPITATEKLRERACGEWECRRIAEIERDGHMELFRSWHLSLRDVALRALAWFAEQDDDEDTLVVAHGALLRSVLGVLDGTPWDRIGEYRPANCELILREVAPGTWSRLLAKVQDS